MFLFIVVIFECLFLHLIWIWFSPWISLLNLLLVLICLVSSFISRVWWNYAKGHDSCLILGFKFGLSRRFNWWVLDWLHVWPICKFYSLNSISESCEFEWTISFFEQLSFNRDSLFYCLIVEFVCESNIFLRLYSFLSQLLFMNHDLCIVDPFSPRFLIIEFYSSLIFAFYLDNQKSNIRSLTIVNLI